MEARRRRRDERAAELLLDALTWIVALLLALALARALRDYWRRRGYIAVAQDDRNMFSRVLLGARDSWDDLVGAARPHTASTTTASMTSTDGG